MALALLAALMLSPAQSPTIEDRIASFLKGDEGSRKELLKIGAAAIRPLQKAREQNPAKVDAIVLELKKGATWPKGAAAAEKIEAKKDFQLDEIGGRDALAGIQYKCGVHVVCDRFQDAELKSNSIAVMTVQVPAREALDQICKQAGLDYGFFHNAIVVGKPERLWGDGKEAGVFGPPATERQPKSAVVEEVVQELRISKLDLNVENADLVTTLGFVGMLSPVPLEIEDDPKKMSFTMKAADCSVFDFLCLATQVRDLDFMFKEGKIVINTRAAIAKAASGKK